MTDLKQRVIENIQKEGAFDMNYYGHLLELLAGEPGSQECGTACCLAGHIVAAAAQLELSIPDDCISIPIMARQIWAIQYGHEEANRLDFNNRWGDLHHVTVQEIINHINGERPVYHRFGGKE